MLPSASRERPGYRAGGETPGTPLHLAPRAFPPLPVPGGRQVPRWQHWEVFHLRFPSKVLGHNLGLEANLSTDPLLAASPSPLPLVPGGFAYALGTDLRHLGGVSEGGAGSTLGCSRQAGRMVTLVTLVALCVVGQAVVLKKACFSWY